MKGLTKGIALLGFAIAAPLSAHHMAEGVISPELWDEIDENLSTGLHNDVLADMLDTDISLTSSTMVVVTERGSGDIYLKSTAPIEFADDVPESDYEMLIELFITDVAETTAADWKRIPSGTLGDDTAELFFDWDGIDTDLPPDGVDDEFVVYMFEPIGNGNAPRSQAITPVPVTGKRSGG